MRILILLPDQPQATGNSVTAERLCRGLRQREHQVRLLATRANGAAEIKNCCQNFQPQVAVLLHAYRCGAPWLDAAPRLPFTVLLTGTDIHGGLDDAGQAPVIHRVLSQAGAIFAQAAQTVTELRQRFPTLAPRLHHLPPGIWLGRQSYALRGALGVSQQTLVFLHPAGLRPVKGNLELLEIFAPLAASEIPFRLAFCGPSLEPDYSRAFFAALKRCPWAAHLGVIPPAAMAAAYREADVILNNSRSEGLSNAVAEAAALGRPLLVTAIAGNLAVVRDGVNGFCCSTPGEFTQKAGELLRCHELRLRLSQPDGETFSPERETAVLEKGLLGLVQKVSRPG
ncbi:Glycosyltransferase involved in cell wall bisynthesis [Geoalkalibacter ferrihydriticus]|uniref:Glycosyltransferase involved in cell wall bisynthesis n=1 Tax=Geoalkalibacter ferrihydriticus TaxID=392333 RepID=A0A1G9JM59_9BACT|nr:glycosyltransferase [Geoalkalibacter ferrihydriticus]SDL38315.1 Glycosyltransferase involved in cell wall bisynthesis [Geoalkalibacter ferrihydriticus]